EKRLNPPPPNLNSQPAWFDRSGKQISSAGPEGEYRNIALSPNGKYLAFERSTPNVADIWVLDIEKGLSSRLTSDHAANVHPVFSPDGQTIAFSSVRGAKIGIYEQKFGTFEAARLLLDTRGVSSPTDWSRDGHYLLFSSTFGAGKDEHIWTIPLSGEKKPQ